MQIDDLRDFLDILEEYQEVQRIDAEVDWNLEMGAITRRVYDLGAPAVLQILSDKHGRHTTTANLAFHFIAVSERGAQFFEQLRHDTTQPPPNTSG